MFMCRFVFVVMLFLGLWLMGRLAMFLWGKAKIRTLARVCVISFAGLAFATALAVTWTYLDPGRITECKVASKVSACDKEKEVVITGIVNERGKEDIFTIESVWGMWQIPESTYLEYINKENKAILFHFEEIDVFVSDSLFQHSFEKSVYYSAYRVSAPWEPVETFTDEEVQAFEAFVLSNENVRELKEQFAASIPIDADRFVTGMCLTNCLEDGAERLSEG